jgi:hypothetical protein
MNKEIRKSMKREIKILKRFIKHQKYESVKLFNIYKLKALKKELKEYEKNNRADICNSI